jgi:hypothetical protein
MRIHPILALVVVASFPGSALADMGPFPGFSSVPHDFVFEVETDSPDYRCWLVSPRGAELLDLAAGRPVRVDGAGRTGSHRIAYVIAVPLALVEELGEANFAKVAMRSELPPSVKRSEHVDFYGSVAFFDSRSRVVDRYRVEITEAHVRLVWLEQNAGSDWVKAEWAAAGIFLLVAALWIGWWVLRRLVRRLPTSGR